jgi:hypothetical protein
MLSQIGLVVGQSFAVRQPTQVLLLQIGALAPQSPFMRHRTHVWSGPQNRFGAPQFAFVKQSTHTPASVWHC